MKPFLSTFAAILCAAAVIFGVYSWRESVRAEKALQIRIATLSTQTLTQMVKNMGTLYKEGDAEKFRKEVLDLREIMKGPKFPRESVSDFEFKVQSEIREAKAIVIADKGEKGLALLEGI